MKKMPLELKYDKIVIGSSLEAVLYAFYNRIKLIYTRILQPDENATIEDYGHGTKKYDIWNKYAFQLTLAGYVPFGDKVDHIRYVDENTIKITTREEGVYKVTFNKLYLFDDHNLQDIPGHCGTTSDEVRVLDWFHMHKGVKNKFDGYQQDTRLMNNVVFYKKPKSYNGLKKHICVISQIKRDELEKYKEHYIKIKTETLLPSLLSNKSNDGDEEIIKIPEIEIEHIDREVFELGQNIYEDFDNVVFVYTTPKILFDANFRRVKIDYMKYLRLRLGIADAKDR